MINKTVWNTLVLAFSWVSWLTRNYTIFKDIRKDTSSIFHSIISSTHFWTENLIGGQGGVASFNSVNIRNMQTQWDLSNMATGNASAGHQTLELRLWMLLSCLNLWLKYLKAWNRARPTGRSCSSVSAHFLKRNWVCCGKTLTNRSFRRPTTDIVLDVNSFGGRQ